MSKNTWFVLAPIGLILTGAGLSIAIDANGKKTRGEPWFAQGTLGLVCFNAGLSIFGDAVRRRAQHP